MPSAPQVAAIASRSISEKINYRLLANTVAEKAAKLLGTDPVDVKGKVEEKK